MAAIARVRGASDWRGGEIADSTEWRLPLGDAHRAELLAALGLTALGTVSAAGLAVHEITREGFPLPTLGPVLRRLADELTHGRGFGLVEGVPVTGLSERECEILAVGIGCHVGTLVDARSTAPPIDEP
jgi:hypothetical protein